MPCFVSLRLHPCASKYDNNHNGISLKQTAVVVVVVVPPSVYLFPSLLARCAGNTHRHPSVCHSFPYFVSFARQPFLARKQCVRVGNAHPRAHVYGSLLSSEALSLSLRAQMTQLSFLCKENEHTTIENGNERALRVEVIILTKNVFAGHRSINERERESSYCVGFVDSFMGDSCTHSSPVD